MLHERTITPTFACHGPGQRVEEDVLRARHGREFDDYAQRVSRFWPNPWTFQTSGHVNVHMTSLWNECARASRWVWLPALGEILMRLRSHVWVAQALSRAVSHDVVVRDCYLLTRSETAKYSATSNRSGVCDACSRQNRSSGSPIQRLSQRSPPRRKGTRRGVPAITLRI